MNQPSTGRRRLLQLGAGIAAAALLPRPGFADVISDAKIVDSTQTTSGAKFKKSGKVRIGFSNGFSGNTWRTECLAAMRIEAAKHPEIADFIVVDGQGDITKQVNDIQDLISQQVDAILCIANSGTAVAPALRKAMRAGIAAVPFNLPVEGEHWDAYIGTDPSKKGARLGAFLHDALGGKGKIVALGGLPGNSYTAAAWAGAKSALGSGIEVLAFKDAFWQEDKAKVVMADLLTAYPEIDGVWCDGGQDATGAAEAMLAAGRKLVPMTGDDYNGFLKLYAREHANQPGFRIGAMSEPSWEGVVAIRTALKLLAGDSVPKTQTIEPTLITDANYQQYIRPDLPDGVFIDTNLSDAELKKLFH
ncbi:MAG TPA: ABC transporter substrate-binding protein [Acetobacteraceae bacterium]|nr:ABC transporter substrate-binding protein [Acetobacteraceae bacterium]